MWEEIFKTALESGLWAALFCVLLIYLLRDARARESKYRDTVDALIDRLGALDSVSRGLEDILCLLRRQSKKKEKSPRTEPECGKGLESVNV